MNDGSTHGQIRAFRPGFAAVLAVPRVVAQDASSSVRGPHPYSDGEFTNLITIITTMTLTTTRRVIRAMLRAVPSYPGAASPPLGTDVSDAGADRPHPLGSCTIGRGEAARRRPCSSQRARDAAHSGQMRRTRSVECSRPPSTETPIGVSSIVREHRPQQAVVSVMGYSPSRCTDHLCVDLDPAADSNQTMVPVCRPSQRSSRPARDPGFAPRPVGVTTPNGLAWTWKPITCRCKTIIQAAFGLWV